MSFNIQMSKNPNIYEKMSVVNWMGIKPEMCIDTKKKDVDVLIDK
jgi:hypothetical protein